MYLTHTVTGAPAAAPPPDPLRGGGVRLGAVDTVDIVAIVAEYTDLRVTSGDADCTIEVRARKTGGAEGFRVAFGAVATGDHYVWTIGGRQNKGVRIPAADATTPGKTK
ncbi:hypothetical protein [Streptomyces dysideae]|uniref:Uncharacterized protein n=1 Tax=Streptomyces dysideae TaxID=909626 RepID=A0A101UYK4_9ACTN|nr:hypothetical protein [Streptomyces dysideae]KUO19213.1 hypothetical protein AQJ91_21030 [Streptomyces dysideae]